MSKDRDFGRLAEEIRATQLPPPAVRRALREGAGLSGRESARHLRVSPMTLLNWERGTTRPTRENAIAYRAFLDVLSGVGE